MKILTALLFVLFSASLFCEENKEADAYKNLDYLRNNMINDVNNSSLIHSRDMIMALGKDELILECEDIFEDAKSFKLTECAKKALLIAMFRSNVSKKIPLEFSKAKCAGAKITISNSKGVLWRLSGVDFSQNTINVLSCESKELKNIGFLKKNKIFTPSGWTYAKEILDVIRQVFNNPESLKATNDIAELDNEFSHFILKNYEIDSFDILLKKYEFWEKFWNSSATVEPIKSFNLINGEIPCTVRIEKNIYNAFISSLLRARLKIGQYYNVKFTGLYILNGAVYPRYVAFNYNDDKYIFYAKQMSSMMVGIRKNNIVEGLLEMAMPIDGAYYCPELYNIYINILVKTGETTLPEKQTIFDLYLDGGGKLRSKYD